MTKIIFDVYKIGPWVCQHAGGTWVPGKSTGIGLERDGELIAGVLYEDFNGAQVICHIAATAKNWTANREYMWMIFDYPFSQMKVKRITVPVAESNIVARAFVEGLGFELEFIAEDAHPDGGLVIYKMKPQNCRWLALKDKDAQEPAVPA